MERIEEIVVNTYDEIIDLIFKYRDKSHISFRGQRDYRWRLNLHKIEFNNDELNENLIQYYKICNIAFNTNIESWDYWRMMFNAQHFGLITRLIDITTNPLVGLYFATENVLNNVDDAIPGVLWIIRVSTKRVFDYRNILKKNETWIYINPPIDNMRIKNQSGKFIYLPPEIGDEISEESLFEDEYVKKIIIGKVGFDNCKLINDIRRKLWISNVHHYQLFPDQEGAAKYINKQWREIAKEKFICL